MKSEVYSWRVSTLTKDALETEARRQGVSIATLLERITQQWMKSGRSRAADQDQQVRLRTAVLKTVGTISGANVKRSRQVRELIRQRLRQRYGR